MAENSDSDNEDVPQLVPMEPSAENVNTNDIENVSENLNVINADEVGAIRHLREASRAAIGPEPSAERIIPNEIDNEANNNNKENDEQQKLRIRREARQRKILENAKDRLAKLNGRELQQSNAGSIGFPAYLEEVSDPEVEPDIPQSMRPETFNTRHQAENMQQFNLNTLLGAPPTVTQANPKASQFWQKSRLHVILVALLTSILHVLGYTWTMGISIFVLFGVCITTELLLFTRQKELDPMVNLVIMFLGIPPRITKNLVNFLLILFNVSTDMGIFVFSLCTCLVIFNTCMPNKDDALNLIEIK